MYKVGDWVRLCKEAHSEDQGIIAIILNIGKPSNIFNIQLKGLSWIRYRMYNETEIEKLHASQVKINV